MVLERKEKRVKTTTRRNLQDNSERKLTIEELERLSKEAAARMSMRIECRYQHAKKGRYGWGPDGYLALVPANWDKYAIRSEDFRAGTAKFVGEYYTKSKGIRSKYASLLRKVLEMEEATTNRW